MFGRAVVPRLRSLSARVMSTHPRVAVMPFRDSEPGKWIWDKFTSLNRVFVLGETLPFTVYRWGRDPSRNSLQHDLRNLSLQPARRTQSEAEALAAGQQRKLLDWSSFDHQGRQMSDLRPLPHDTRRLRIEGFSFNSIPIHPPRVDLRLWSLNKGTKLPPEFSKLAFFEDFNKHLSLTLVDPMLTQEYEKLIRQWEALPWSLHEKSEPGFEQAADAIGIPDNEISQGARSLFNGLLKSSVGVFPVDFGLEDMFLLVAPMLWSACAQFVNTAPLTDFQLSPEMHSALVNGGPQHALVSFIQTHRAFPDKKTMIVLSIADRVWAAWKPVDELPVDFDSDKGIYAVEDAMSTLAMMQSLVPDYELPIPGRRKNPLFSPRAQLTEAPKNFAVL